MKNIFQIGVKLHWIKNLYLRYKNGAGCCDIHNLDYFLAKRILPPLKAFRNRDIGEYPSCLNNVEEWKEILDKMIFSFDSIVREYYSSSMEEQTKDNKVKEGLELFAKYFQSLWR